MHHMIAHSDAEITVLDKMSYAANRASLEGLDPKRFTLVQGDICDYVLVNELVPQHDAVIHFAGETHNDNSLHDPRIFLESNVMGTFELLEAVRHHEVRLHHISTDEVYGDLELDDPQPITQHTCQRLSVPNGMAKGPRIGAITDSAAGQGLSAGCPVGCAEGMVEDRFHGTGAGMQVHHDAAVVHARDGVAHWIPWNIRPGAFRWLALGLGRSVRGSGKDREVVAQMLIALAGFRAVPGTVPIDQAVAALADPADLLGGHPGHQCVLLHVPGDHRAGGAVVQAPMVTGAMQTARAPMEAPSPMVTATACQSSLPLRVLSGVVARGYRSLVSTAAGPMNTPSASRAGS